MFLTVQIGPQSDGWARMLEFEWTAFLMPVALFVVMFVLSRFCVRDARRRGLLKEGIPKPDWPEDSCDDAERGEVRLKQDF